MENIQSSEVATEIEEQSKYIAKCCTLKYQDKSISGSLDITTTFIRWKSSDQEIAFRYKDFICFGISTDQTLLDNGVTKPSLYTIIQSQNYEAALGIKDESEDKEMLAYDECKQQELVFIPENEVDVDAMLEAFNECNMMNPDTDDSQDEEEEELFTKEYFDQMDKAEEQ